MKRILQILPVLLLFLASSGMKATTTNEDCNIKYNLFKGSVVGGKYEESKADLEYLLNNCATLSVNIYKYGAKAADKTNDHDLYKKVYEARLVNFPKKGAAKAHSDYASYLAKHNLATEDEIFEILKKAYEISPKDMGVKNIYKYFEGVLNKNKDTNPQKVFDTYDDVMESVGEKLDDYQVKIAKLAAKEEGQTISAKEARLLKAYRINSKALGTVEGGLDAQIAPLVTCERLIPILTKDFEANKTNEVWLKRAVSRLYKKGCKEDPLFEKLAVKYSEVSPSADACLFVASILEKNGKVAEADAKRKECFDLETDPVKKGKLKLNEAYAYGGSKGRAIAYEALKYNPNMGKAYLYIASLYAKSANKCGTSVFEKKMVYVAALNMARKAQKVDPGSGAGRYINSYKKNVPTKKEIFQEGVAPGSSHKVKCWINETVRVPQ